VQRRWSDRRIKSVALQTVFLAAVVGLTAYAIDNIADNLRARGVGSGFDFLDATAGFKIGFLLIEYSELSSYGRAFVVGVLNTLLVSAIGIVLATALGFAIGLARLSSNWLVARLAGAYVEILRNLPLLLQIFFWYFAVLRALPGPRQSLELGGLGFLNNRGLYLTTPVPGEGGMLVLGAFVVVLVAGLVWWRRVRASGGNAPVGWYVAAAVVVVPVAVAFLAGFSMTWDRPALRGFNLAGGTALTPELIALVLSLSTYTAAFIAENVRGGVLAVARGQSEAAAALGLSRGQALRYVVVPQALRVILPPLASQFLNLTKNSSLAAAIAYPDLISVFAGTVLNQTGQAIEVIALVMAVYLTVSLTISAAVNLYNRRVTRA